MNDCLIVIVQSSIADASTDAWGQLAEDILEAYSYGQEHDLYPTVEANLVKGKWKYRNLTKLEVEQYEPEILSV